LIYDLQFSQIKSLSDVVQLTKHASENNRDAPNIWHYRIIRHDLRYPAKSGKQKFGSNDI